MNGATRLVAIIEVPCGIFSISGIAISVNSSFGKERAGDEQHDDRDDGAQQPVAQLHQMRDQRAFGELLAFICS